jgi:hypothetical protein
VVDPVADRDLETDRPLEGDAVLRDVDQRADAHAVVHGDEDAAGQRRKLRGAVAMGPEEHLAPLGAVELFVVSGLVDQFHGILSLQAQALPRSAPHPTRD